ncbi:MAG: ATP-dependent DNA ligase [Acidimicrobiales bacterium]
MKLPVMPPVAPMLAKLARELPSGSDRPPGRVSGGLGAPGGRGALGGLGAPGGWVYEPKWDGFRSVVFRDGAEVELGSRNERPLTRYFPELVDALRSSLPERCVMDGEIVIAGPAGLDFDALLQRIHPAASRVALLAVRTPASFVAFDLLALGDLDLRPLAFAERRAALEEVLAGSRSPVHLTPATTDRALAAQWFERFEGAGLDGVVAKPGGGVYLEGSRSWVKVKHERTADCVVGGFRWHRAGVGVGSLLLGLYDAAGTLHHVGVTASFTDVRRRELVDELAGYRLEDSVGHPWAWMPGPGATGPASGAKPREGAPAGEQPAGRRPGGQSRWSAGKDLSWEPLVPELVCEVAYDHLQGARFRHAATFRRWRADRAPQSCRYDQLEVAAPEVLSAVFGS